MSKYNDLYNSIKNEITSGQIEYGGKLPSVRKASAIYSLSRTTVQNAYFALAADGYIITDTILSQASAVITGSDDLLGKVDTITIPSQNINADGLSADKTYTFRLSDYVPSGIKFVSDSSLTVTVKIAQKATKQISLSASEITLNNIQTGFNAQVMQGITFTVTGNDNVLSAVSASDVKAGIDLKNLGAGTHNVTVALSLPDGITVVGNVTVNVTITAIQQETTTESTKATESTTSATR